MSWIDDGHPFKIPDQGPTTPESRHTEDAMKTLSDWEQGALNRKAMFLAEYRVLCLKHGLVIKSVYDDEGLCLYFGSTAEILELIEAIEV